MKDILKQLVDGCRLSTDQAHRAMTIIMEGGATDAQIGAYLVLLKAGAGPTIDEITGSAVAMREKVVRVFTDPRDEDILIDTCGTGGSGLNPFNISTAAAFVLAAGGLKVAKHGNRGVSSSSGSADVLMELGVNIEAPVEVVSECIHEVGVGYLFAPRLHPAMRYALGPRREIELRTIFNVLGPLTNPASVKQQVMGVFSAVYVNPLAEVLGKLGVRRAMVVHGNDGLDEITTTTTTHVALLDNGEISNLVIDPRDLGIEMTTTDQLAVADPKMSAAYVREALSGKAGPRADIVALNAAAGFVVCRKVDDLAAGVRLSRELLASGRPVEVLARLVEKTQAARL